MLARKWRECHTGSLVQANTVYYSTRTILAFRAPFPGCLLKAKRLQTTSSNGVFFWTAIRPLDWLQLGDSVRTCIRTDEYSATDKHARMIYREIEIFLGPSLTRQFGTANIALERGPKRSGQELKEPQERPVFLLFFFKHKHTATCYIYIV